MSRKSTVSILRIAVIVILVFGALISGGNFVSTDQGDPELSTEPTKVVSEVLPTEEPLINLGPTSEPVAEPTATSEPVAAPTQDVEQPEEAVPTEEPQQTGRQPFEVPENTTGRSIVVERGPEDTMTVALSFDAGEGRGYTEEILDLLAERGLHASFGTTAEWAYENPDLIARILDEGHLLFNHSATHQSWTGASSGTEPLSTDERTSEVMGAHDAVLEVADWNMQPFWRPPYGDLDQDGQALLQELGYDYTFWWTCDTLAWMETTPEEIADRCSSDSDYGGPGAIILMHVAQENDYLALEQLIDDYSSAGYEFVTLDKMIPTD